MKLPFASSSSFPRKRESISKYGKSFLVNLDTRFRGHDGLVFVALIGFFMAVSPAHAAVLKTEVIVAGETVTLGDIFEDAGENAGKIVTASPAPGHSATLEARALLSLARANGLDWQPESNFAKTTLRRASQSFEASAIEETIGSLVPQPALGRTSVKLDNQQSVLHAPVGEAVSLSIANFSSDPATHRFGALARLENNGQTVAELPVSGKLVSLVNLPVLTRPMRKGDIVSASDIDWQEREMTAGMEQLIFNAEEIIGKTPRQAVRAGVPLRGFDLAQPVVIARGSQVTMIYENGRMHLSTQGRALGDGAVGDSLRVVNLSSSRTVEGRVEADGTVRIGPAPQPQLAAAPRAIATN